MSDATAIGLFETLKPEIELTQQETLAHIERAHRAQCDEQAAATLSTSLRRFGVKPSQIASRSFENLESPLRQADIFERNQFFGERAHQRLQEFYPQKAEAPSHVIHVTCTGYVSPSAPQRLVNERGWSDKTNVTHAYHMGCYASLPAIRLAKGLVASEGNTVDVVHTEMCGLHLDGNLHEPEQLVVQSLFADGHAKYSVARPETFAHGFRIENICERIVSDSFDDMSWIPSSLSMRMTLSRDVPMKIRGGLRSFVQHLTKENLSALLKNARFAIHPGGPKIIDAVLESLELSEEQVATSREILRTRGNMSSATLPHVWANILEDGYRGPVVSLAFGPGLTIFGAVFEAY